LDTPLAVCSVPATALPTKIVASHAGTRIGGGAPTSAQKAGIHSRVGAGSSSTMLYTPLPCSSAHTAARAASSTWTNENIPSPAPTIGSLRRLASRMKCPDASK
jgi:hypothetical protein